MARDDMRKSQSLHGFWVRESILAIGKVENPSELPPVLDSSTKSRYWDVVKTFFPTNGKPIVTKGTCKQYMIQDGKFLQSDFTFFDSDGTKSTGTGISGFDPKTNRFTTVWYDSRQTTMSIRQSDGTFDGKNIVLWTTPLDSEHPGPQDRRACAP
jgi:hypothetical protein